jgi:Zn-dependent protease/predicted transcriptional regulator
MQRDSPQPAPPPSTLPGSFRLGRVLGFPVYAHWSWFIIFFLIAWSLESAYLPSLYEDWSPRVRWLVGFAVSALFFASILAHELAHAVVARRRGYPVPSITLHIFGGVSALGHEPRNARDEFQIAIVGPLTSFAVAILCGVIWFAARSAGLGYIYPIAGYLGFTNALLGAFNLVPGFPLDGGRVLRSALWARHRTMLEATRIASTAGRVVAGILAGLGVVFLFAGAIGNALWFMFIAWFLWSAAETAYQQLLLQTTLHGLTVESLIERDVPRVPPDLSVQQLAHEYVLRQNRRAFFVAATDDGDLLGLITLSDLRHVPEAQWPATSVYKAMTPRDRLVTVSPSTDALAALQLMAQHNLNQLPVLRGRDTLGIVTRAGLMQAIQLRASFDPAREAGAATG